MAINDLCRAVIGSCIHEMTNSLEAMKELLEKDNPDKSNNWKSIVENWDLNECRSFIENRDLYKYNMSFINNKGLDVWSGKICDASLFVQNIFNIVGWKSYHNSLLKKENLLSFLYERKSHLELEERIQKGDLENLKVKCIAFWDGELVLKLKNGENLYFDEKKLDQRKVYIIK